MVSQITKGIKVSVSSTYQGAFLRDQQLLYAFSYDVTIENTSQDAVQLFMRHWEIHDALNEIQFVDGDGVIGKQPVIAAKESHNYCSGSMFVSPFGSMKGFYLMQNLQTLEFFKVQIPTFKMNALFALN